MLNASLTLPSIAIGATGAAASTNSYEYSPVLYKFQGYITPLIIKLLIFLTIVFLLSLAFYILVIVLTGFERSFVHKNLRKLKERLKQCVVNGSEAVIRYSYFEKSLIKEIIIEGYHYERDELKRKAIREIYKNSGFFREDLANLKSFFWWRRVSAIENLERLNMVETDRIVASLLNDKNFEVKYSAVKMLAATRSPLLPEVLPTLLNGNERWAFRYLVNKLYNSNIPNSLLLPLIPSENRDIRKAAAVLLGKWENSEAVAELEKLLSDSDRYVRLEAFLSMVRIGTPESLKLVVRHVRDEKDAGIRAEISRETANHVNVDGGIELLELLAGDDNFKVAFEAFFSLSEMGEEGHCIISKLSHKYPELSKAFIKTGAAS